MTPDYKRILYFYVSPLFQLESSNKSDEALREKIRRHLNTFELGMRQLLPHIVVDKMGGYGLLLAQDAVYEGLSLEDLTLELVAERVEDEAIELFERLRTDPSAKIG